MSLLLGGDVELAVAGGVATIGRRGSAVRHELRFREAVIATFLAALGSREETGEACRSVFGEDLSAEVGRFVDRYWTYLGGTAKRTIEFGWLDTFATELKRSQPLGRRLAAPASVIWLVTLACNRRCPYCFYKVTPHAISDARSPADATFSFARVLRLLDDMRDAGTPDLYLTGGEPLLRRDLPAIVEAASALRIRTHITTKYPITLDLASRLAEAGLAELVFSLDDARPRAAAGLAGAAGFLAEARTALAAIVRAGLDPEVNAVATAVNLPNLRALVELLVSEGINKLSVSPYIPPYPVRDAARRLEPKRDAAACLDAILESLRAEFGQRITIRRGGGSMEGAPVTGAPVCDVGFRELHVLPDGGVSRCRYLPDHDGLRVGSLESETMLEIWNGSALAASVAPERSTYRGTGCFSCGSLEACNARGRCIVGALQQTGRIAAPDPFCLAGQIQ